MSNNRNSEMAKKLNSLQFCNGGASTPLNQLTSKEISALHIGSEIRFSDFNEKTLSKLESGEISAMLELECSSYAYVLNSSIRPLTNENVDESLMIVPEETILENYYSSIDSMYEKIINNSFQNKELTELRDWLLPMLMNGQLKVN